MMHLNDEMISSFNRRAYPILNIKQELSVTFIQSLIYKQ